MRSGQPNSVKRTYARLMVGALVRQLEKHDQRCQICYLVEECARRKALRWWRSQWKQRIEQESA